MGRPLGKDRTGERYGRLVVLRRAGHNEHRKPFWLCKCDCGNQAKVLAQYLHRGETRSCGCLAAEVKKTLRPPTRRRTKHLNWSVRHGNELEDFDE